MTDLATIRTRLGYGAIVLATIAVPSLIIANVPNLYWPIVDNQPIFWGLVLTSIGAVIAVNHDTAYSDAPPRMLLITLFVTAVYLTAPFSALVLESIKCSGIGQNAVNEYARCSSLLTGDPNNVPASIAHRACLCKIEIDVADLASGKNPAPMCSHS